MEVSVQLLGRFVVEIDGRPVPRPGAKSCALLAYLAVRADWVDRAELTTLLYAECDETRARRNLRQLLHAASEWLPDLERHGSRLRWRPATDLARFLDRAEHGDAEAALTVWRGDLLEDLPPLDEPPFLDWLALEQERLRSAWRGLVLEEAHRGMGRGDPKRAAELLGLLTARDPLDEEGVAALMRALAAAGRVPAALDAYGRFAKRLESELAVRPAPATRELADALRRGDLAASTEATPSGPKPAPLPRSRGELVGREAELAALGAAFASGRRRVTLTGLGGAGKSRLALAYAARAAGSRPVAWLDGRRGSNTDELARELLRACGRDAGGDASLERRLASLGPTPYLIVLDDPSDAEVARAVLTALLDRGSPALRVLVTARRELGDAEEHVVPLAGLDPGAGATLLMSTLPGALAAAADEASVRHDAERIARATGGLPLALRLAAGWSALMPLAELARRVERSAAFLTDPSDREGLRRVLDETLASLDDDEREAFARLGAFAAPFPAVAAHALGASFPVLMRLRNRGLVERYDDERLALHPLLAERARERLDGMPDRDRLLEAHAEHHLRMLTEAGLGDTRRPRALARLDAARQDLLRAWSWAAEHGRHDLLTRALWDWVDWHGADRRDHELARTVAAATPDGPPLDRARFELAAASRRHDDTARSTVESCLAVFEAEDACLDVARSLENLAVRAVRRADFEEAARRADRGLTAAARADARSLRASLLNIRASPAIAVGAYGEAEKLYRAAMAMAEDAPLEADRARGNLADLYVSLGRPRTAVALADASLGLSRTRRDPEYALRRRHVRARALRVAGDDEEAEAAFRRQLDELERADLDPSLVAELRWLTVRQLVRILGTDGRTGEAVAQWRDAPPGPTALAWARAAWLADGGWLAFRAGDPNRAAHLVTEALDVFHDAPATSAAEASEAHVAALIDASEIAAALGRDGAAGRRCAEALRASLHPVRAPSLLAALAAAARLLAHVGRRRAACLLLGRVLADPRTAADVRRASQLLRDTAELPVPETEPVPDVRLRALAGAAARRLG